MKTDKSGKSPARPAFTLVELLVVIAVIAILAAMIIPIASTAKARAALNRATAELKQLEAAIDNYQSKRGIYPPGGTNSPALNPLFFELTGTFYTDAQPVPTTVFQRIHGGENIQNNVMQSVFGLGGFINSAHVDPSTADKQRVIPASRPANRSARLLPAPGAKQVSGRYDQHSFAAGRKGVCGFGASDGRTADAEQLDHRIANQPVALRLHQPHEQHQYRTTCGWTSSSAARPTASATGASNRRLWRTSGPISGTDMTVLINLGAVGHAAGKAVEDYRTPRRCARHDDFQKRGASWTAPALWSFAGNDFFAGIVCVPMSN